MFFLDLMPVVALCVGALMVVLRAGASRVFFDVVGSFQATRLIDDAQAKISVMQGIMLDGLSGIGESVGLISDQMQQLVDATVPLSREVAMARIEFDKFANFAGATAVRTEIEAIGEQMGFTADQALMAGARMAQLSAIVGGGASVGAATQTGIEFGLIGGMTTEAAMTRMINLQQQTAFMYGEFTHQQIMAMDAEARANIIRENSIHLLNQLNTVENRSAANMEQITFVMNQFAAQGNLVGDSITYMAAASATMIEAGEEQGKAGRALRIMYARLAGNTSNNRELLAKYGIAVTDTSGNLRSMQDVITDMSAAFVHLSEEEKVHLAQAIAGNDHYVRALKLIENHNRTLTLNKQAMSEADTAADELNRRFEDMAFQLTQAETRLSNARAAIGDELLPTMVTATNIQAAFNEAIADMAADGGVFGALLEGGYMLQQYLRIFSPVGEAYLNIMSMNVSLNTQQAILRAINGEEIVRANAYGARTAQQRYSMNMLAQEQDAIDSVLRAEMFRLSFGDKALQQQSQFAGLRTVMSRENYVTLQIEKSMLQQQINADRERLNNVARIAQFGNAQERTKARLIEMTRQQLNLEKLEAQHTAGLTTQDHLRAEARRRLLETEKKTGNLSAYRVTVSEQQIQTLGRELAIEQAINRIVQNKSFIKHNEVAAEQAVVDATKNKMMAEERLNFLIRNNNNVTRLGVEATEADLAAKQARLAVVQQEEARNRLAVIMQGQFTRGTQQQTEATRSLMMIEQQFQKVIATKVNAQTKVAQMDRILVKASEDLARGTMLEAGAVAQLLRQLPQLSAAYHQVSAAERAAYQTRMSLNTAMMQASGVMGVMSMYFGMFGEDEKAMRTSMILMTLSMLPATVQMMGLGAQTATTAAGMVGLAAGQELATQQTYRLTVAQRVLSKSGIGAIVGIIAVGAVMLTQFTKKTKEATDEFADFGTAVTYTSDQLNAMGEQYQTRADLAQAAADREAEILDLQEDMESSQGTFTKFQQNRLDALMVEREILQDLLSLESARALAAGETLDNMTAQEIYDVSRTLNDLYDTSQMDPTMKNTIFGMTKELGESGFYMGQAGPGSNIGLSTVAANLGFGEERLANGQTPEEALEAYNNALGELPASIRGAVIEAAMAADSFDDFMLAISEFAEDDSYLYNMLGFGESLEANYVGPLEQAKDALFDFANARDEMFFGMSKGNVTGDMVKQVVNKGVETLINTTEVFMTNNFNGMTTEQAANTIVAQVERKLQERGVSLSGSDSLS